MLKLTKFETKPVYINNCKGGPDWIYCTSGIDIREYKILKSTGVFVEQTDWENIVTWNIDERTPYLIDSEEPLNQLMKFVHKMEQKIQKLEEENFKKDELIRKLKE